MTKQITITVMGAKVQIATVGQQGQKFVKVMKYAKAKKAQAACAAFVAAAQKYQIPVTVTC
jgi:hypothetical protein